MTTLHDDSIQAAVERETARRKRVFLIYLGLLLVPLAIGAFALARAPTETELVAERVAPVIEQTVGTRVAEQVASKAAPMIQENVSREVAMKVEPRLQEVSQAAGELRGSVSTLGGEIQRLKTTVAAVPGPEVLAAIEQRVAAADATAKSAVEAIEPLRRQQAERPSSEHRFSQQLERFSEELERQNQARKELGTDIGRVRELVESNMASIRKIEARVAALEKRMSSNDQIR